MAERIGAGRAGSYLFVGWLGLSLVASLQAVLPLRGWPLVKAPDVTMLVALFAGLSGRGTATAAALLAVVLGYLADLSAGSPRGLHMVACLLLVLLSRSASSRLLVRGPLLTAAVAAFFAAVHHAILFALRVALDPTLLRTGGWGPLRPLPAVVLSSALFAPFVFALLRRIDRSFGRDPRALSPAR